MLTDILKSPYKYIHMNNMIIESPYDRIIDILKSQINNRIINILKSP